MTKDVIMITAKRGLNKRDVELVKHLADGKRPQEIANLFGLSKRTIEAHVDLLRKAFMSETPAGLVATFFRNNLIK